MARRPTEGPTDAEFEILHILWRKGPSTVRDVFEALNAIRETGYTTALKLLQIMADKGLVTRDESNRSHVYTAAADQETTEAKLVGSLLDRVFSGSREKLLVHAIRAKKITPGELERIRKLLDDAEKKRGK